jgi:hypothetical protein
MLHSVIRRELSIGGRIVLFFIELYTATTDVDAFPLASSDTDEVFPTDIVITAIDKAAVYAYAGPIMSLENITTNVRGGFVKSFTAALQR